MAQQTELKLNQHYYPRTEANTTFAYKDHPHDYAENSYSMLLLLGNNSTTKSFTKNIGQDVILYASVKNKGNTVETGWVDFIANGLHYPREITSQNGGFFAALTIKWNQVANYRVTATYRTKTSNYSLCADHCMITVLSPYQLQTSDITIQQGGKFSAFVKKNDSTGALVNNVQVVFKINGQLYGRETGVEANNEGKPGTGEAFKAISLQAGKYFVTTSCFYNYTVGQQNFSQEVNQNTNILTIQ